MIRAHYGEYLITPWPLELTFNRCSYGCTYCWANMNVADRQAEPERVMRFLAEYPERQTLEAVLMQQGYPVMVSNTTDPFAPSNIEVAAPILTTMAHMGVPMAWQTRGADHPAGERLLDELLEILPPQHWLLSVCQDDDAARARLEPHAPSLDSRFRLMEKLAKAGHCVNLSLHPFVPEWFANGDPYPVMQRAKDAGAWGCWIELLHFNHHQARLLSPQARTRIGAHAIARGIQRDPEVRDDTAPFYRAREIADRVGLHVLSVPEHTPTRFWEPVDRLYARRFPVTPDFVNWCHANVADEAFVGFEDFWRVIGPHLAALPGEYQIGDTIRVIARNVDKTHTYPRRCTYETLSRIMWSEPRVRTCPINGRAFAYPFWMVPSETHADMDEPAFLLDERETPVALFSRQLFDTLYAEIDPPGLDTAHDGAVPEAGQL